MMDSARMNVPHYWTADQVKRLLDALASHNRHQARTAALIMWRTGLRVSEVLELEWRDLDYSVDPATVLVRKSKSRRARTVRLPIWCSCSRTGRRTGRRGTSSFHSACARLSGTSAMGSNGRALMRSPQGLGGDVRVLTA